MCVLEEGEERYMVDPASREDPKVKELVQVSDHRYLSLI